MFKVSFEVGWGQCSATRMKSQHAGYSARARIARVLACNWLIFKNLARARRARVRTRFARGVAEH